MTKESRNEWFEREIGLDITIQSGFPFSSDDFRGDGVGTPLIRIRDLLTQVPTLKVSREVSNEFYVNRGDLLVGMDGDFTIVKWRNSQAVLNQRICKVVGNSKIDTDYLFHLLSIELPKINARTGSTTVKHLANKDISSIVAKIPPHSEQKKIAEILTSVDEVIENTQSQINKLVDLKKATMNELLTKGIGHTEFKETEIGKIPKSWKVCLVKDLFAVGRGRVISAKDLGLNPGIYPVFSSQSKDEGVFGYLNTYDFEGEHITWTTDGAYAGTVFYRSGRFNCTNVCGVLNARNRATTHTRFLSYYLSSVAKKYVSYVGNPKLMNNIFSEIPVVLPPHDEQMKIDTLLLGLEQNIKSKIKQFTKVSFLKKSLMQDLLTGKVRVTVN